MDAWKDEMNRSPESRQVFQNLLAEPCLEAAVEAEFFNQVEARGVPRDAKAAWASAVDSVWAAPTLNFKRGPVPAGRFDQMIRFTLPEKLTEMFPGLDVAASGLSLADLSEASPEELTEVIDEARTHATLQLNHVVWVTEVTAGLEPVRARPVELMDRLGHSYLLAQVTAGGSCIELRYARPDLPADVALHVPSVLDGIDNPDFRPQPDCSAPCGTTAPFTMSWTGFSEAIHGSCTVTPFGINVL
ncbi:MAG: hypothetical protein JWO94_3629 [Verrucomicrobiaceae bacterium]|nr:hypothetical protein [Verrucomicrobiaceae bacterium]